MKSILVTGGLGFIGSNYIRILLEQNDCEKVINLDKQTYAGNVDNLADFESDSRYVLMRLSAEASAIPLRPQTRSNNAFRKLSYSGFSEAIKPISLASGGI